MTAPAPDRRSPDYQRVIALVKEIGSKNGFEPIPRDQIGWQRVDAQPPLQRMWAWMLSNTLYKGHWSPYACTKQLQDGGEELHLENAAKTLRMHVANVYRTWKQGVDLGLWRNGTPKEGKRKLFICGSVPQPAETANGGEGKANAIVCTDNLPFYILNKIKEWAPEKQDQFWAERAVRIELRNITLAELVKAGRTILAEDDDTHLLGWGLAKRRQEHKAQRPIAGREARIATLLPEVRQSVLTIFELVQSQKKALYKPENGRVQTTATLLSETSSRKGSDTRATAPLSGHHARPEAAQSHQEQKRKQLPAVLPPKLTLAEQQAVDLFFSQFRQMQKHYPRSDFGADPISPAQKNDQLLVYRVVSAVGASNAVDFLDFCIRKFKGLDRNALGKQTPRSPDDPAGPRSFGLILTWAVAYGEKLDEAARASAEEKASFRAREIAACQAIVADPHEPEDIRQHCRSLLASYGCNTQEVSA